MALGGGFAMGWAKKYWFYAYIKKVVESLRSQTKVWKLATLMQIIIIKTAILLKNNIFIIHIKKKLCSTVLNLI